MPHVFGVKVSTVIVMGAKPSSLSLLNSFLINMGLTETILARIPGEPLQGLRRADRLWQQYREGTLPPSEVIGQSGEPLPTVAWDVAIAGGTLGILLGAVLAQRGWKVLLLERGPLRGRNQEWNISRRELQELVELEVLTPEELEAAIASEYNPGRIAFHGGAEFWVKDVLNVGVDPVYLLETLKQKFLAAGGCLKENTGLEEAIVHPNGVQIQAGESFSARLLVDAMGHFSAIARQARGQTRPDAVCMVVGTCGTGFPRNETGDLFVSFTPLADSRQYFWEAFPARDGRTTYLFTYGDTHPDRPSLETLFDDYFRLLPDYQQVDLEALTFKRALFGFFPCYRQSPLPSNWDRVLHVGDSSGSQSPLSFGGFGAMIRHLHRLADGVQEALQADTLGRKDLSSLQPYQPSLSVTWLFQQSMSARIGQALDPAQINHLLSAVFTEMVALGDPVLKPFLQDVVQFTPLAQTLARTTIYHPGLVLKILPQVGISAVMEWLWHYGNLGVYTGLHRVGRSLLPWIATLSPAEQYRWHRRLDTWTYGAGLDYNHPSSRT